MHTCEVTIYDKSGPSVGFAVSKHEAMDEFQAAPLTLARDLQANVVDYNLSSNCQRKFQRRRSELARVRVCLGS